jgi:hypothetical protein
MSSLGVSLSSVGISRASGVELVAQREQLDATLPVSGSATNAAAPASKTDSKSTIKAGPAELTADQRRAVAELQEIDRNVRAHEQAHIQAGRGVITSGPNYTYTYGPDGKQYAVGGEVGIDTSPERKPEANIDKGVRIQAAALAPRDPSPQDYRVATVGGRLETQGRSDLAQQRAEERSLETERNARAREESLQKAYAAPAATPEKAAPGEALSVFA